MPVITTTLPAKEYAFLSMRAEATSKPKNAVICEALRLLEALSLEEAVRKGFEDRTGEYAEIAGEFHQVQKQSLNE